MKKILLLSGFVLSFFSANAQLSCAAPTVITANGTITAPAITGTYGAGCWAAGTNPNSIWYSYTATANGEVTVSSNLSTNVAPTYSDDTRLSIFTGTCGALTCYDGNDDVSGTNYKSALTFAVQAGTTYYIVWDDRWSDLGFQFTFNFSTVSCIRPTTLSVNDATNITATSASISWATALGNPASYDVDHGAIGHVAGAGTIVNTTTTSVNLSSLPASSIVEFYLRSNCGGTQSGWVGPFSIYLAKTLPYSNNFDNTADYSDGFTYSGFGLNNTAGAAQSGTIFLLSNTSTTATTNAWVFSRPISLQANEQVTFNFQSALVPSATTTTLNVTVGNDATIAAQTTNIQTFAVTGAGTVTYVPRTATWTAPTAGTYYFGLNNSSPIVTTASSLLVDTVTFTSVLSNNDFIASSVSVYPNPANSIINLASSSEVVFTSVQINDLNGRTVKSVKLDNVNDAQINISDLASGVYMMNISSDQGSAVKKIIKN